jgi:hypothetical protein
VVTNGNTCQFKRNCRIYEYVECDPAKKKKKEKKKKKKQDMQQITEFLLYGTGPKVLLDRWKARQEEMAALREEREADPGKKELPPCEAEG